MASEPKQSGSQADNSGFKIKLPLLKRIRRWTFALGTLYLLAVFSLVLAEPYLVYPVLVSGNTLRQKTPALKIGFVERPQVRTADDLLIDCFHYCPHDSVEKARGVFLVCHGNGEWIARMETLLVALGDTYSVSVFCFDYRGYGQSQGFPSEKGILKDVEAAYQAVVDRGYAPEQIIVYGRSIGGGPSCYLAATQPIGGLILHNTFSSLVEVAASKYSWFPVHWMMRNRYPSATRLHHYDGPLLQTHGTGDRVVPIRFGKKLFAAAGTRDSHKEFVVAAGGRHNDPVTKEFQIKIKKFSDQILDSHRNRQ